MGYHTTQIAMQHSIQADYKALRIKRNATATHCKPSNSNQAQRNVGRISLSLSLSLSLVSQLFICNIFFQYFKSFCSFLWILLRATHSQHIFCYAKNRYACVATKSQATSRNDELAKIHKIHFKIHKFTPFFHKIQKIHNFHKFFSNFHSKCFQNFEKFNTKEQNGNLMRKIHAKGVKGFGNESCGSTNKQFAMANSIY